MEPIERSSRTWLCTVVFVDIVKYTNHPVSRQLVLKARLNEFIAQSIDHVALSERVILDTGDGAALCFMGDPEDGFFAAIDILNAFESERKVDNAANLRIGIHLGPVKIVKDLNQHHNIVGDAINVAQRIMSFAAPNQMLVSRAFHEVISPLSLEHARMFQYLGLRKDKHVREHAVYEVCLGEGDIALADSATEVPRTATADVIAIDTPVRLGIDPDTFPSLERCLAFYIGPLARVLVKREARKASSLRQLCDLLAAHLPDPDERERFLSKTARLSTEEPRDPYAGSAAPTVPRSVGSRILDPSVLRRAEAALARHIGPVARILIRREQRHAKELSELYERLAVHIAGAEERRAFLETLQGGGIE